MSLFPKVLALSGLDGVNGFKIVGATGDIIGFSVASAGDVNGDGLDDFIVGAYGSDVNGDYSGAAYVVFGNTSGFGTTFDLTTLDGANGFRINGVTAANYAGQSVSSAGDVNGDGFDDMIVGAIGGGTGGAAYVVFGTAAGFDAEVELSALDGADGFLINGEDFNGFFGRSVSSAGDLNGDGFDDVIVGAYEGDGSVVGSGASYVVFGQASGFDATIDVADLDGSNGFKINGKGEGDFFGLPVASAGDVNADGFDDLIVGATESNPGNDGTGSAYVIFGKASAFAATFDLTTLNGARGFQIKGGVHNSQAGFSVSSGGDFNGDGYADMIVGDRGADLNGSHSGAAYIVFGDDERSPKVLKLGQIDGHNGFAIVSGETDSALGSAVSAAGDVNGDGFADVIVGAPYANPHGIHSGTSYVVFGTPSPMGAMFDVANLDGNNGFRIDGVAQVDSSGRSVSAAGDVNGDGFDDLMVGAPGNSGASYIIYGVAPDAAVIRIGSAGGQTITGGNFDDQLSGLSGDDFLRGNGGDDEIFGGDGNDIVDAAAGDDFVKGGSGDDTLNGGDDVDQLSGGSGNDVLNGDAGSDAMDGGSGNDTLSGGDGNDNLIGSDGTDALTGGNGADRLVGGDGKDTLTGGNGADRFVYASAADSTGVNFDIVKGADFAADVWDVQGHITGIDTAIGAGTLSTSGFDAKLATAVGAAQLAAHHAILFAPDAGNLSGKTFLVVDLNGVAGYQGGIDLVVQLTNALNLGSIDTGDFI